MRKGGDLRLDPRTTLVALALAAACGSAFLPSAGASSASPAFRVNFSFSAVSGERPPNILESRRVGKGTLSFEDAPDARESARATAASGRIALGYDILSPHPHTAKLMLKVTGGIYESYGEDDVTGYVLLDVKVVGSTSADCPLGKKGHMYLAKTKKAAYVLFTLPGCDIKDGQRAKVGKNSRVHVFLDPQCLRQTAAATGKPLCSTVSTDTVILPATIGSASPGPKKFVPSNKAFGPGTYTVKITGAANTWPGNTDFSPFSQDAVYCYDGCAKFNNGDHGPTPRLSPLISIHLPGGGWGEYGHLAAGKYLPYSGGHVYTRTFKVTGKGTFGFAFQDTQPADNTGGFTIAIKGG